MKKWFSIAMSLLLAAFFTMPVFAHGSHHGGSRRNVSQITSPVTSQTAGYTVCGTKNCTLTGLHTHNGKTYIAHYYGDGHNYHSYCELEDCVVAGYHSHDNVYSFGHTYNDGHDYHGYCNIADCAITGYHGHDGAYCFGHNANDGHSYHHNGGNHY